MVSFNPGLNTNYEAKFKPEDPVLESSKLLIDFTAILEKIPNWKEEDIVKNEFPKRIITVMEGEDLEEKEFLNLGIVNIFIGYAMEAEEKILHDSELKVINILSEYTSYLFGKNPFSESLNAQEISKFIRSDKNDRYRKLLDCDISFLESLKSFKDIFSNWKMRMGIDRECFEETPLFTKEFNIDDKLSEVEINKKFVEIYKNFVEVNGERFDPDEIEGNLSETEENPSEAELKNTSSMTNESSETKDRSMNVEDGLWKTTPLLVQFMCFYADRLRKVTINSYENRLESESWSRDMFEFYYRTLTDTETLKKINLHFSEIVKSNDKIVELSELELPSKRTKAFNLFGRVLGFWGKESTLKMKVEDLEPWKQVLKNLIEWSIESKESKKRKFDEYSQENLGSEVNNL